MSIGLMKEGSSDIIGKRILNVHDQMRKDGVKEGMLLEVILFEGARYDNGETRGGWGEYGGRREFDIPFRGKMTQKPAQKVMGTVVDVGEHGLTFDVLGNLYIPCCVIHSYKILEYKK